MSDGLRRSMGMLEATAANVLCMVGVGPFLPLLRHLRTDVPQPFVMWLYPLPAVISLALWGYLIVTAEPAGQWFSAIFMALAMLAWMFFRRLTR
ncbi:MAG: hypothetical protein ACYCW6_28830 [Candidatus Xenobia bacterium]